MSTAIKNRLRRISGQLDTLESNILNGEQCSDVIPQFLAVKGALNAAFLAYVQDSLSECKKNDQEAISELIQHLIKS